MLNELQIEQAARKLCEIRGVEADYTREINLYPSNKELAEREIRAHLQVQEAVAYVEPIGALERIDPAQYKRLREVLSRIPE